MKEVYLGVDLGGTRIKAGLIDAKGDLIEWTTTETEAHKGREQVLKNLAGVIETLLSKTNVSAVGVAVASPLDPYEGVLFNPPNLPFGTFNIKEFLQEKFNLPIVIENDANAYVLGEWWKGAGAGAKVLLGITLGTGIGGGLVYNGQVWHGAWGLGGEFGHITILADGPLCNCGNRGCFEALASSKFLIETYKRLSGKEATPKVIYQSAIQGEKEALESFRILSRNVAVGLASLCNALNPDVAIIGGGLANAGMLLLEGVRLHFDSLLLDGLKGRIELRLAKLKDYSAVYGVVYKSMKAIKREVNG